MNLPGHAPPWRSGRTIVIGFRRWRRWNLRPLLHAACPALHFVHDLAAARALQLAAEDRIVVWGAATWPGLDRLIAQSGAALVRIEDGFIRSVGLGSDLIPPRSLVFDAAGIYFDATRPSALEQILATAAFDPPVLARASALRALIVARGLTKYNVESHDAPCWHADGRPVVLVPGQVESDASIALGCGRVRTNRDLLAAARAARPDAMIVYKPHPDVMAGNRRGRIAGAEADHVETRCSILACLGAADEVHTMTSLAGFDALMRGVKVVTYGVPFYAGWGLTHDRALDHPALARRQRRLTLDELVAGALITYPLYWDPVAGTLAEPESALAAIASEHDRLLGSADPQRLMRGFWRRQARRAKVVVRAALAR